ncbi:uncharacterized protein TrAFT101_006170 [Trichoderma asperellum]|uniref:uncharacterized protein n=1 Tax=Trichoderma asperellum TaxID=101201 RepID=UPI0033243E69|nr:hypothetical protein TrAFT101_006170 [Trichoderma asperellum]
MTDLAILASSSNEVKVTAARTGYIPGTCLNCRRQKQRCDRVLPQCSRCTAKAVRCVYPTKTDVQGRGLAPISNGTADMLMPCSSPCRFHLSPLGERNLLWAACSSNGSYVEGDSPQPSLSRLVRDIFGLASIDIIDVVAKYFSLAYYWFPFSDKDAIYGEVAQFISGGAANHDEFALLLLSMHVFSESTCEYSPRPAQSALYRTSRQLFVVLQSSPDVQLRILLQCGIILTMYACGHGLGRDAYETLTICIGLIRRLSFNEFVAGSKESAIKDYHSQLELDLYWSAIILLDRTIALSTIDHCLPYLVEEAHLPPNSAILRVTQADLYSQDSIRNFLARAEHAIRMGDTLRAIRSSDLSQYEVVEREMCSEIGNYIRTTEGSNFPICETIAMTLSALIMLYRTNDYYKVSRNNPKSILTFNCARNMIIETCRAESEWLKRHGWFNSTRPCFIGLCCLYGAAAHLDELCADGLSAEDKGTLRNAVSGFAARWKISDSFLRHLDSAKRF